MIEPTRGERMMMRPLNLLAARMMPAYARVCKMCLALQMPVYSYTQAEMAMADVHACAYRRTCMYTLMKIL